MYFAYRNLSKIFKGFQGYLEIPWKILESLKHSTLALIYTSLENVNLDIALKFKVFQGQLKFSLEIFGWSSTLKILDVFRKGYLDLDWTLNFKVNFKEPWNSRLRFSSLIICFLRCNEHLKRFWDFYFKKQGCPKANRFSIWAA